MKQATVLYVVAAGLATVVYLALPWSVAATGALYIAHELAAATAIVLAVRWRRPRSAPLWWLIAGSLAAWAIGDVVWFRDAAAGRSPYPSVADGFYLLGYAGLAAGMIWLVTTRQRGRQVGDLLDALLVTVGLGVPIWLLAIGPAWTDATAGTGGQLVGSAYSIGVLVLVLLVAWAALGGMLVGWSGRLLTIAFMALIAGNLAYSIELLSDLYVAGGPLDVGWLAFFALSAGAALHPSVGDLHRQAPRLRASGSTPRVVFVWAMASVPPVMIVVEATVGAQRRGLLVVAAIGTIIGVSLMAVRVRLLIRQTDRAARSESEQRLAALIEHIHDVITLHEPDGRVRWISPAIEHAWGESAEDPRRVFELMQPGDRDALRRTIAEVCRSGRPGELRQLEADVDTARAGRRRMEITAVNQLSNPAIAAVVVTFHDVTTRVSEEKALQEHADAQSDLAEQLQRAQDMKDTFLTAVSHDLRTPLTSIRGMSELLTARGDALPSDRRRLLLERIAANAERLEQLLLELLDLDRLSRGIRRPERAPIDVADVVRDVLAQDGFRDQPIVLSGEAATAQVDPAMLSSIVQNLIGNAVKHTPDGTPIWVRIAGLESGGVRIVVEDAGAGIPADRRAHVIQAFTRLDESRSSPGHGLGLALVDSFTRLHGGRLDIDDREGGGARLVAELPAEDATLPSARRVAHRMRTRHR